MKNHKDYLAQQAIDNKTGYHGGYNNMPNSPYSINSGSYSSLVTNENVSTVPSLPALEKNRVRVENKNMKEMVNM